MELHPPHPYRAVDPSTGVVPAAGLFVCVLAVLAGVGVAGFALWLLGVQWYEAITLNWSKGSLVFLCLDPMLLAGAAYGVDLEWRGIKARSTASLEVDRRRGRARMSAGVAFVGWAPVSQRATEERAQ